MQHFVAFKQDDAAPYKAMLRAHLPQILTVQAPSFGLV
jgi:hypothetical protein